MPASIAYGKLAPVTISATTAAAGYGADNVGLESITRAWRATGVGANDVILTLAAVTTVHTLHLHDCNFASAAIYKSADGVAWTLVGTLNTYQGRESRRRGQIVINDANVKAVKVSIGAGVSTDGLAYWRIGSAYLFSVQATIASPLQFPYAARFRHPQVRSTLPNGQEPVAATGPGFHLIETPYRPFDSEDLGSLVRLARASTVLLNLGLSAYPFQVWPVRLQEDETAESFDTPRASTLRLTFREVV